MEKTLTDREKQIKEICINEIGYSPSDRELEILSLNCNTINDVADMIYTWEAEK